MEEHQMGRVDPQSCQPKNWLVPVLLSILLRKGPSYGYEMLHQIAKSFGMEKESAGTVYRILRRMEKDELVKSSWEISISGPARRVYTITEPGAATLADWADALNESRRRIDAFLKSYHGKGA